MFPAATIARRTGTASSRANPTTKNTSIEMKRNPKYDWGPATATHTGAAHLDGLTIKFITEDSVRVGALVSGHGTAYTYLPRSVANFPIVSRFQCWPGHRHR